MAAVQNKGSKSNSKRQANRTTGKRKSTGSKKVHNKINEDPNKELYHDEITLIITLVISLLLILSNFDLSGVVGKAINSFTFGLAGFIAYLLPFLLFFGVAFHIANRGNRIAMRKLISAVSLGIILTAFIQLSTSDYSADVTMKEYYLNSASLKNGGGIIGGFICRLLHSLFDTVGTYIILIALMIVCVMFITGKALFAYLGTKSEASLQQMKERRILYQEAYDSIADTEDEVPPKRKARTVLLKKDESQASVSDGGVKDSQNKGQEDGIFSALKKKKKSSREEGLSNAKAGFDMEEITTAPNSEIPIQRASEYGDVTSAEDIGNSYEEQMRLKFGRNESDNQAPSMNEERPGIDADIERLLRAAKQDVALQNTEAANPIEEELVIDDLLHSSGADSEGFVKAAVPGRQEAFHKSGDTANSSNSDDGSSKSEAGSMSDLEDLKINQRMEEKKEYVFPPVNLLSKPKHESKGMSDRDLKETALKLQKTLESFGVRVTITNVSCGPSVTRYELQPEQGVKVSKITGLADDIKLNLAAADVRIEAPIPGKAAVGIEVPNKENSAVMFRDLIESKDFKQHPSDIAFAVGKDIGGQTIVTDIGKMPHLLIAGATGSGKSVCINTLIMSILYKAKPSDVRMIMVDPKVVELSVYNGIPHLLIPVVTDPKKASAALNWAVMEMTERYKKFADLGVRDVKGYNEKIATVEEYQDERYQKLPQIVIIVDELADLMMVAPGEVEDAICRLAQMARAAGLHLIIATQRPSVNVITGLIKANIPSRIAFSVSSAIDSRTIIDGSGAEKLLGKGDMLFFPSGYPKPVRVQGAFISDKEVGSVVEFLAAQNSGVEYSEEIANKITNAQPADTSAAAGGNDRDEYFIEAGKFIIEKDKASIGMLQRVYKIGFNRAARIMDQLAEAGVVGPEEGTKPRKILMSTEEFEQYVDDYV
ncbi:DNA translocase FtsK 4TM domain-containing protein [Anaerocolumna sp. AGMB13025]|uniref:FtsK/SpoIIIE family DNA translocase n=1 Tax=Anaerocolumna sp. AGMB13025 TaxID=3039116 RepID=UPI00241FBE4A|nr:DNA translocase FtsK [Anaerocolumna sp. AGMB13025]WFR54867.1 DNA translocase FtsK 4TM domain-containing protein [Anaerocolumna sp. AGMB13025]